MDKPIRVGLIGYGRAGRAVARVLARAEDVSLCWITKQQPATEVEQAGAPAPIHPAALLHTGELFDSAPVDVVLDFSTAAAIRKYGKQAAVRQIAIISAVSKYPPTTKVLLERLAKDTVVMSSPNITLGINYLLVAAQLLQHIAPFTDIEIIEEHFRDKTERSGTALRIAQKLGLDESKVNSIRVGGIVGRHEVVFGFPFQTVRLVHDSISREAFGTGALFALRKLRGRAPGLYAYEDILREAMIESLLAKG
ncbi:MAG: dihydrodipicolinate reductase C-terminal domain-containing protein [Pseudomonadota bacterium]